MGADSPHCFPCRGSGKPGNFLLRFAGFCRYRGKNCRVCGKSCRRLPSFAGILPPSWQLLAEDCRELWGGTFGAIGMGHQRPDCGQ